MHPNPVKAAARTAFGRVVRVDAIAEPKERLQMKEGKPDDVLSHWDALLENFQFSPLTFYAQVERALQERKIPDSLNARIDYKESGILSARREYLHIERERLVLDICGAPFGSGFFVSWWLAEPKLNLNPFIKVAVVIGFLGLVAITLVNAGLMWGTLLICLVIPAILFGVHHSAASGEISDDLIRVLPLIGPLYVWLFKPATYYRIDTMLMFQKAVHNAVLDVLDEITKESGIRALSDLERKPIMKGLLG
jgi:hypothetical protein